MSAGSFSLTLELIKATKIGGIGLLFPRDFLINTVSDDFG